MANAITVPKEIVEWLKEERERTTLSQMSKNIPVAMQTLSNILNGGNSTERIIKKIEKYRDYGPQKLKNNQLDEGIAPPIENCEHVRLFGESLTDLMVVSARLKKLSQYADETAKQIDKVTSKMINAKDAS